MKALFLQIKFFLVEFLNITYQLIPNPLRNYYLKMFGISLGGVKHAYIGIVNSFMWER